MPYVITLRCPHCGLFLRTDQRVDEGTRVKCPGCAGSFEVFMNNIGQMEPMPVLDLTTPPVGAILSGPLPRATAPKPAARKSASKKIRTIESSRNLLGGLIIIGVVGSVVLFVQWYANQVRVLNRNVDIAAAARAKRLANVARRAKGGIPPTADPAPAPDPATSERTFAPATLRLGMLAVGVSSATRGPILGVGDRAIPGEFLTITLRITNLHRQPLNYRSWSQRTTDVILKDKHKNYYNRVPLPDPPIVENSILPNQTITDVIVFEPPIHTFDHLELDLPPVLGVTPFQFMIPGPFVQRTSLPPAPGGQGGPTSTASPLSASPGRRSRG